MSFSLVHQLTKGDLMSGPEGGGVDFILDTPYLVILEDKKTDTLPLYSLKAELLGQVRVLQKLFLLINCLQFARDAAEQEFLQTDSTGRYFI